MKIKVQIITPIVLEMPSGNKYSTDYKEVLKKENADIVKESKKLNKVSAKLSKEIQRLNKKIELAEKKEDWEKSEELYSLLYSKSDELEEYTDELLDGTLIEDMFKAKLEICLVGKDADKILLEASDIGFQHLYTLIASDVAKEREGN